METKCYSIHQEINKFYQIAQFSEQQHTFRHPTQKIGENFFGKPIGSPMTKNTLFLVFYLFWGALGNIFQKNPKFFVF